MKLEEIYVLKNKDNGKYFYEEYRFTLNDLESWKVETDNIFEVAQNYRRYYLDKYLAENKCIYYSTLYNLNLEVVLMEKHVEYKYKESNIISTYK